MELPFVGIWNLISKRPVRGVEPGITGHFLGYIRAHIFASVSLRVCSGPQRTRSFSSELATERKFNTFPFISRLCFYG